MTMNRQHPSIFNDVVGPVMRGPSSSHCAASMRIGRIARALMDEQLDEVLVEFDPNGSLATTHESHGSDMGLFGGFLGWDLTDVRIPHYRSEIKKAGITVTINISDYETTSPNTYKLTLKNSREQHEMIAISTGGGMLEIIEIDGIEVSICGDYYETLIFHDSKPEELKTFLAANIESDEIILLGRQLIELKSQGSPGEDVIAALRSAFDIRSVKMLPPVLPIVSRKTMTLPFGSTEEMFRHNQNRNVNLWELAAEYESARGNISADVVLGRMKEIVVTLRNSINDGVEGTEYKDRILGYQSGMFRSRASEGKLLGGDVLNRTILYVTAMMEMKSSMGVIVAAPTAGACAALPGSCLGAADAMGLTVDDMTKALLAAGIIGVFISNRSTFAAEICGCQAECGAASGMAAAGLVTLANGTAKQAVNAASMALQNVIGLVCDPVANRVEVPCLGRNVMAASNALACANMALADFDAVIPLDEVIDTMDAVGRTMASELRCTALGGLSITPTSKNIEESLK
jgi:L-serine dehydratase